MCVQIEGGRVLRGELRLSGAKNAALPMLVAACLAAKGYTLERWREEIGAHLEYAWGTTLE